VATSSVASALVTWGALVAAGRQLGPSEYTRFMVVWGAFFAATGVLAGLQQEVTRSVATARETGAHGPTPLVGSLLLGGLGAGLLAVSALVWGPRVFGADWWRITVVLAAGFAAYALANFVTGTLAGTGAWSAYSLSIVLEGLFRASVVGVVVWIGTSELVWALALTSGLLGWVVMVAVSRAARETVRQPASDGVRGFSRRALQAVVAAGCSALVVAGFPVLMSATSATRLTAEAGVVMAVVLCTRAPLLLLLSFQGPLIRRFVRDRHLGAQHLRREAGLSLATFVLAAGLAYVVGPPLMRMVFGGEFDPPPWFVAVAVLGAGLMGGLTVAGWLVLVRGRHGAFVLGWLCTTCVTAAALMLPLDVEARSAVALVVGPLAGGAIYLPTLWLARPVAGAGVSHLPGATPSGPRGNAGPTVR
jgi:O-antigen/teichoic acid export membrane protein